MADSSRELTPTAGVTGEVMQPAYPLLEPSTMDSVVALMKDNLGDQSINVLTLPKIKVPSGGGLNWRIETLGGEESAKEVEGLLVAWRVGRVYWKKAFGSGGGKKPPDCSSTDGFVGIGDPGGPCAACPFARFGSALDPKGNKGSGQACKEVRQLLVVLQGEILPHLINIPPTSLKNFNQFTMSLLSARVAYYGLTVKLALEKATNEGGIEYARVVFRPGRRLNHDEFCTLLPYHDQMAALLRPAALDAVYEEVMDGPDDSAPPPIENPDDL